MPCNNLSMNSKYLGKYLIFQFFAVFLIASSPLLAYGGSIYNLNKQPTTNLTRPTPREWKSMTVLDQHNYSKGAAEAIWNKTKPNERYLVSGTKPEKPSKQLLLKNPKQYMHERAEAHEKKAEMLKSGRIAIHNSMEFSLKRQPIK
jgi:hypothetical protein